MIELPLYIVLEQVGDAGQEYWRVAKVFTSQGEARAFIEASPNRAWMQLEESSVSLSGDPHRRHIF